MSYHGLGIEGSAQIECGCCPPWCRDKVTGAPVSAESSPSGGAAPVPETGVPDAQKCPADWHPYTERQGQIGRLRCQKNPETCPSGQVMTSSGCQSSLLFGEGSGISWIDIQNKYLTPGQAPPVKHCLDAEAAALTVPCIRDRSLPNCNQIIAAYSNLTACPGWTAEPMACDVTTRAFLRYCGKEGAAGPNPDFNAACWLKGRFPGYLAAAAATCNVSGETGAGADEGGSSPWLWISLGAAALGVAYFATAGKKRARNPTRRRRR